MKLFLAFSLLSAIQGFMVPVIPAEMSGTIEKLVNTVPTTAGQTDPLDLASKAALVPFIVYAPFYMKDNMSSKTVPTPVDDEIDYDAPLDRQLKVDHIIRRQPYTFGLGGMGTVTLPSRLQQAFNLYEPEKKFELPDDDNVDEHYYTLIHDECYLGKDCTAHECVDFDPMHVRKSKKLPTIYPMGYLP